MYKLPYFKEKDNQVILAFIRQHPFAFIAGCNAMHQPVATQIPILLEEREGKHVLLGHMMKNTDHHNAFEVNDQILCVFTGPHTYVSASWYHNPQQASTWNYMSVHVKGRLRFLDESALMDILQKTSLYFEKGATDSPTVFENLPTQYSSPLLKAILAFEIEIESIDNVFKLSQNRDSKSYQNIIEKLESQDEEGRKIADEMRKRESSLFKDAK